MSAAPIVVGYDGSPAATSALRWAIDEAAYRGVAAHIVCVVAWPAPFHLPDSHQLRWPERGPADDMIAAALRDAAAHHPGVPVTAEVAVGQPARILRHFARTAEMVVIGSAPHGRLASMWDDPISVSLATEADTAVVLVRPDAQPAVTWPVLVGMDGDASMTALRFALSVAAARGVDLIALHAWKPPAPSVFSDPSQLGERIAEIETAEHHELRRRIAQVTREFPAVPVRDQLAVDSVVHALAAGAKQAQLLVVGTQAAGRLSGILGGAIGVQLLRRATVPVAVVRMHSSHDLAITAASESAQR